jgi:DNA polymerase IV
MILTLATTGELQRLRNLDSTDHTIELFMGIYGVGRTKALKFVMQGFRTLQDILERGDLNESQRIGIEFYDVLLSHSILTTGFISANS